MKKFNLTVLTYTGSYDVSVYAEQFHHQTSNSSSSGFYSFYDCRELIACYPIERTIINSIEKVEE